MDYSRGNPAIRVCQNPAAWVYFGTREPTCRLGMLLCDTCYQAIKAKDATG